MTHQTDFLTFLLEQDFRQEDLLRATGFTRSRWRDRRNRLHSLTIAEVEALARYFTCSTEQIQQMVIRCYPTDNEKPDFSKYTSAAAAALGRTPRGRPRKK